MLAFQCPRAEFRTKKTELRKQYLYVWDNLEGCISIPISWKTWFHHFATDNVHFVEDTSGGRNTLHGTVMVAYQKCDGGDVSK